MALSDKAAEMRRKYYAEWRKKHKESVRKYNKSYWERKAKDAEKKGGEA